MDLVPGGARRNLTANRAAALLSDVTPSGAPAVTRWQLASELVADVRQLEQRITATEARIKAAVVQSNTSLVQLLGIGPVLAATFLGEEAFTHLRRAARSSGRKLSDVASEVAAGMPLPKGGPGRRRPSRSSQMVRLAQSKLTPEVGLAAEDGRPQAGLELVWKVLTTNLTSTDTTERKAGSLPPGPLASIELLPVV